MSLLFNALSRFDGCWFKKCSASVSSRLIHPIYLPKSKRLLISWLQSQSAVILETKKIKSDTVSIVSPYISHEVMGLVDMTLLFLMLSFKQALSLSSITLIKRLFRSFTLSAISGIIYIFEVVDISLGNLDSSLCFIQPSILHDILCIEVK